MPSRIQIRERVPVMRLDGAIYVGPTSPWQNPISLGAYWTDAPDGSRAPFDLDRARRYAVEDFRTLLGLGALPFTTDDVRRELRGRDLVCWCSLDLPCHGDVLLEVANA